MDISIEDVAQILGQKELELTLLRKENVRLQEELDKYNKTRSNNDNDLDKKGS